MMDIKSNRAMMCLYRVNEGGIGVIERIVEQVNKEIFRLFGKGAQYLTCHDKTGVQKKLVGTEPTRKNYVLVVNTGWTNLADHRLYAEISHWTGCKNIVTSHGPLDIHISEKWRLAPPFCGHCGLKAQKTYLASNYLLGMSNDGSTLQLCENCLGGFAGDGDILSFQFMKLRDEVLSHNRYTISKIRRVRIIPSSFWLQG